MCLSLDRLAVVEGLWATNLEWLRSNIQANTTKDADYENIETSSANKYYAYEISFVVIFKSLEIVPMLQFIWWYKT